jgi:hypothetical protein
VSVGFSPALAFWCDDPLPQRWPTEEKKLGVFWELSGDDENGSLLRHRSLHRTMKNGDQSRTMIPNTQEHEIITILAFRVGSCCRSVL